MKYITERRQSMDQPYDNVSKTFAFITEILAVCSGV